MRMRRQRRGANVAGRNLTPTPSANATEAIVLLPRASEAAVSTTHSVPKRSTCPLPAPSSATNGFHAYASTHQGLRRDATSQLRRTATKAASQSTIADFIASADSLTVATVRKKSSAAAGYGVVRSGRYIS